MTKVDADGLNLQFIKMTNVRVYQLAQAGDKSVSNRVLIVSDEGSAMLNALTGEMYKIEESDFAVDALLFENEGTFAFITGIGQNRDRSGMIPGHSTIEANDQVFKVVFALEGFCFCIIST